MQRASCHQPRQPDAFFFVVGLEIKRELVCGELQKRRAAALPVIAALGGVVLPALIFVAITAGTPEASGWAIPAATDIAFAVGLLALLGCRVSAGVKLFLLTIAIVDDIAALAIIAVFYADDLSLPWIVASLCGLVVVVVLRRVGVVRILPYVVVGSAVSVGVHQSGVHATIAGVALGLLTPTGLVGGRNVLELLEHRLHAVTAFAIVPLFALANAGVTFGGASQRSAGSASPCRCSSPGLAFDDPATVDLAKVGIFAGSFASGALGWLLLSASASARRAPAPP